MQASKWRELEHDARLGLAETARAQRQIDAHGLDQRALDSDGGRRQTRGWAEAGRPIEVSGDGGIQKRG